MLLKPDISICYQQAMTMHDLGEKLDGLRLAETKNVLYFLAPVSKWFYIAIRDVIRDSHE